MDEFNLFGDPDELQRRMAEFAEQMQSGQRVAWADNAISLAVDMTVAAIEKIDATGSSDEQAMQVRDAMRMIFPEAVTLVREARDRLREVRWELESRCVADSKRVRPRRGAGLGRAGSRVAQRGPSADCS